MPDPRLVDQLIPNAGSYLQLERFLVVRVVGLVATRFVLVPVPAGLLGRRAAARGTRHSIVNQAGFGGNFVSSTVALQTGNVGDIVTIIGAVAAARSTPTSTPGWRTPGARGRSRATCWRRSTTGVDRGLFEDAEVEEAA